MTSPVTPTPAALSRPPPVSQATLERLAKASSGSLTTQLFKRGFRQPVLRGLRPLQGERVQRFAARAYTVRMIPAREDIDTYGTLTPEPNPANLQWVAVEQVQPGEVMVIDSRGDTAAASMGNMLVTRIAQRGGLAVVTDGAFRDAQELSRMSLPCWSAGITATTRLSFHHVADLQVPISCAGVAVYPGDVIHGDADNLSVVPAALAEELAAACEAQDALEAYLHQRLLRGESLWGLYPPSERTRGEYQQWLQAGQPPLA
ncbi:MAG: ribonuclease activity regulator RraA [Rubrivivax sp.]|nr:ribonuclease activity regulator RraA [Rubrivivax sp.]